MKNKKLDVIVNIMIDMEAKPGSSGTTTPRDFGIGPDGERRLVFQMKIVPHDLSPNPASDEALRATLAHELGHVVASILNTPASANDPRSKPQGNRWTRNPGAAVRASEREAWDIGEEIAPGIPPEERRVSLASYDDPRVDAQFELAILLDSASLLDSSVN